MPACPPGGYSTLPYGRLPRRNIPTTTPRLPRAAPDKRGPHLQLGSFRLCGPVSASVSQESLRSREACMGRKGFLALRSTTMFLCRAGLGTHQPIALVAARWLQPVTAQRLPISAQWSKPVTAQRLPISAQWLKPVTAQRLDVCFPSGRVTLELARSLALCSCHVACRRGACCLTLRREAAAWAASSQAACLRRLYRR